MSLTRTGLAVEQNRDLMHAITGYLRGGVTALAGKKDYPVYLDESALQFPVISVSAGVRGTQLWLAPADYVRAVGARLGAFSLPMPESDARPPLAAVPHKSH